MNSNRYLTVGYVLSVVLLCSFTVLAAPGCLEIQSQSVKYVQLTKNVRRENTAISVALNCCPNEQCCSPGVFEAGYVFQNNGRCLKSALIAKAKHAISCTDNNTPNLPSHQRRATITGVRNGFSMRCFYANENDETFDESVTVKIKVLPQLISFNQQIVEQPERGVLLTCKAALGTYTADSVELSFTNQTSSEPQALIGSTRWDEKITRELTGKEKDVADYLKTELNLTAPYEVELKHFVPDRLVFWRNLTVACQLKLANKEERQDRIEFENLDQSKKMLQISEHNLETLPKVDLTFEPLSKRLKCSAFSFPKATSIKWSFAPARGQNFSDIPVTNVSAAEVVSSDWYVSWYNGPFDPKSVYRCVILNSIGSSAAELELTTTTPVTVSTTITVVEPVATRSGPSDVWDPRGPPSPIDAQFPFYWVIVVVGILIIFAVAIAVILHLRKRAGSEYKSGKRGGDAADDEEQQRLQDNTKSGLPDAASGSNEMAEAGAVKVSSQSPRPGHDGSNSKSTDVV